MIDYFLSISVNMNSLDDWLTVTIKLIKVNNQAVENYLP